MNSVVFMICAVIITNAFCEQITRDKRQTFNLRDRWIWGYFNKDDSDKQNIVSANSMDETKKNYTLTSSVKVADSISDPPSTTTTTVTPFTSRIETTLSTENKSNDISITTESVLVKAVNSLSAEIRLLNDSIIIQKNVTTTSIDATTKATTFMKTTLPSYCERSVKPDFKVPGRRISEAQCLGYIWEMYNKKREADIKPDCGFIYWSPLEFYHIIGGRRTENGEYPHMGAIGWKAAVGSWVFKCGGTLISPKFVLTAAHCSKTSTKDTTISDPVPKIVRLGDKSITDKGGFLEKDLLRTTTDKNIARIIVHPKYDPPLKYYDIALMEFDSPLKKFDNLIHPACLWTDISMDSVRNATLTGWGVVETNGLSLKNAPELMAATVDILDNDVCDDLLKDKHNRNWHGFRDNQICAGKLEGGIDSCQGDSGGPLQVNLNLPTEITETQGQMHYVVGVISFGIGCAHKNLPGIYTRVSSFIDWIEENVWANETAVTSKPTTTTESSPLLRNLGN